jgi:AcrR family transcriptional regulator
MNALHPTKQVLIETVMSLLDSKGPDEINSEEVLEISGISKGSLYYHFQDFPELIEQALISRFAGFVDSSVAMLKEGITSAKSREEVLVALQRVTRVTQSPKMARNRIERISAISSAMHNERMATALGVEQERLTEALADLFRECQERGWADRKFDPRVVGVMIQSYTIGKVVDDFTPEHMDGEKWSNLIDEIAEKVLFPRK